MFSFVVLFIVLFRFIRDIGIALFCDRDISRYFVVLF